MIYLKHSGNEIRVQINNDEKEPYTKIGDKAFLSCKDIVEIKLPDTITEIGNWSFSHMQALKRMYIPANNISIGKDAFLECTGLDEIFIYDDKSGNPGLPVLFAAALIKMKADALFNPKEAASEATYTDWINRFDEELIKFIIIPDESGFQPVLIGWFDDEGEDEQLVKYIWRRQYLKIDLCFMRLIYDNDLNDINRNIIVKYINKHIENTGGDKEGPIRKYFSEKAINNIDIIKCMNREGMLNNDTLPVLFEIANEKRVDPEIMSYILASSECKNNDEVFDEFNI